MVVCKREEEHSKFDWKGNHLGIKPSRIPYVVWTAARPTLVVMAQLPWPHVFGFTPLRSLHCFELPHRKTLSPITMVKYWLPCVWMPSDTLVQQLRLQLDCKAEDGRT